ncbi:MAG: hypothetical protein AB7G88_05085 [Thermomicrobiales bacterium]
MADELDKLYDHIVRQYVMKDELIDVDLTANASEEGEAIENTKNQVVVRETDHARQMRESFRAGLSTAWQLSQNGNGELRLSDQDPIENSIADALIRYLVSFGLAGSRTEQVDETSYVYHVSVDWDRLHEIASRIRIDLPQALARAE